MTTKHTPGPWFADKIPNRDAYNILPHRSAYALMTVGDSANGIDHPYGQDVAANARLIASAPAMLAALQAVVDCADEGPNLAGTAERFARYDAAFKAARAAIAAATGDAA